MAEVAWMNLEIWPWDDAWLAQDPELRKAFDELGLVRQKHTNGEELGGAMNGDRDEHNDRTVISGEMRGASWEIRDESNLLELLQERGIAYVIVGDAKYEWDGDEQWWHPGMREPFAAVHCSGVGRVLDKHTYEEMLVKESPVKERLRIVTERLAESRSKLREAKAAGWDGLVKAYEDAVRAHQRERNRLTRRPRPPEPIEEQLAEFFAADEYAWTPSKRYRPKLKTEIEVPA
jgi:hypothetical protein